MRNCLSKLGYYSNMRLHFITVGEPKLEYAKAGWHEYYQRLERYHKLKITRVRDKTDPNPDILAAIHPSSYVMPLDPRGKELASPELAMHLDTLALNGISDMTFIIGGPEGLSDAVRKKADFLWAISRLTFPHDLAMVVMMEALYRASSINKGEPYHR